MSLAPTFKKIPAAPRTISSEYEVSPAANALAQQSPVSKHLFRPDALFPVHICTFTLLHVIGIGLQVGLKYIEIMNLRKKIVEIEYAQNLYAAMKRDLRVFRLFSFSLIYFPT